MSIVNVCIIFRSRNVFRVDLTVDIGQNGKIIGRLGSISSWLKRRKQHLMQNTVAPVERYVVITWRRELKPYGVVDIPLTHLGTTPAQYN